MAISAEGASLLFRILGDASQARSEFARLPADAKKSAEGVTSAFAGIGKAGDFGAQGAGGAALAFRNLRGELSLMSPMLGRLSTFGGGGAMAGSFFLAAKAGVEYAEVLDKLSKSFAVFTGSEQAAAAHLKELHEFAARTPFEFEEVATASQKFQNMGIAARDVVPLLTAVGNAVARAGGGSAQIERVAKALSDVMARGKVSAQEMNQLANNLVDGWGVLEQSLGRSRGELMKMAEDGKISADVFVKAFREAHEGGTAMQRQMNTLSGAWSTLSDNLKLSLAETFKPLHGALRDIAVELANTTTRGFSAAGAFKAAASAAAQFGFSFGKIPSSAILAQMEAERSAGAGRVVPKPPSQNFLDEFKAQQEKFAKELEKLAPGRDVLAGLQADVRNFGNDSKVTQVTEQFRKLREQLAATGQAFSDEAAAKFDEWERESVREAARLDALIKREEADRKAREEAERAEKEQAASVEHLRGVLRQLNFEYQTLNRTEERRLTMQDALAAGAKDLTGAHAKEADELLRSIEARRKQLAAAEATQTLYRTLNSTIDEAQQAAKGEKTYVDEVTEALGRFTDAGGKADAALQSLTLRALAFARQRDIIKSLDELTRDVEVGAPVGTPGQIPQGAGPGGTPQAGPWVDPSNLGPPPEMFSQWEQFGNAVRGALESTQGFVSGFGSAVGGVMQSMAGALGQSAAAAMVFSQSFGKAMLAATKGALASIAAMAFVEAIKETALGFAKLAGFMPGPAALHFKSAALWTLAGVAAGAAGHAVSGGGGATASAVYSSGGAGGGGSTGTNGYEDYRTKYLRERDERERGWTREDRRGESQPIVVQLIADGRELARTTVSAIRDGHERDTLANALRGAG